MLIRQAHRYQLSRLSKPPNALYRPVLISDSWLLILLNNLITYNSSLFQLSSLKKGRAPSGRAIISSSLHYISGDTPFYPSRSRATLKFSGLILKFGQKNALENTA